MLVSSDYRQLNLWGFKRLTKGQDNGAYYHELFLRGKPLLAMRMKRQRIKGTGVKLSSDPSREPNFYSADFPPLPECEMSTVCSTPLGDVDVSWCPTTLKSDSDDTYLPVESEAKGGEEEKKKHPSQPNLKSKSLEASPRFSEESADNLSKLQFNERNTKRSREESSPLFINSKAQIPMSTRGDCSRGEAVTGQYTSDSSSAALSKFPLLPSCPTRDQLAQKEIAEVEFILRKQRQELELLTALTELKKQVSVFHF